MIKKILVTALMLSFFITPINAAELKCFETDYDNSVYTVETVIIDTPESVPSNWYPLRKMANMLHFQVEWDARNKTIIVHHKVVNDLWNTSVYTLQDIEKSNDLMIVDGVTFCSPYFLYIMSNGFSFVYDDAIYYYSGESVVSELIRDHEDEFFRAYVNTSMYELYLKYPECYKYIRTYLDGGIERSTKVREGKYQNVLGYTYPFLDEGICFILGDINGARLTSIIVHEATHVYQARNGLAMTEDLPNKYGDAIYHELMESNKI